MPGMKVRMEFAQKDEIAFRENERKMLHTSGLGRDRHTANQLSFQTEGRRMW